MVVADNKELLRHYIDDVMNRRNLAAIDEFLAPDQVDHSLPRSLPPNTTGTKRAIELFLKAFPDLHVTIDEVVAEGDRVVARFTSHGTRRLIASLPSTGRQMTATSYLSARIAGGKIVEQWGLDDQLGVLRQLGVVQVMFGFTFLVGLGVGIGIMALVRRVWA
jgi:predicted ester cyclase